MEQRPVHTLWSSDHTAKCQSTACGGRNKTDPKHFCVCVFSSFNRMVTQFQLNFYYTTYSIHCGSLLWYVERWE